MSQVKTALGLPAAPVQDIPVAGPSSGPPVIAPLSGAPPPIALEHSESDEEVQTLAVPVRSGSSEAFLPMVSTDDSWSTDTEFRFVSLSLIIFGLGFSTPLLLFYNEIVICNSFLIFKTFRKFLILLTFY